MPTVRFAALVIQQARAAQRIGHRAVRRRLLGGVPAGLGAPAVLAGAAATAVTPATAVSPGATPVAGPAAARAVAA